MTEHLDRALERALQSMPAPGFKDRLRAELERKIRMTAVTTSAPAGFRTVTTYLLAADVDKMLAFYAAAFGAETTYRAVNPRGGIHSSFRIGDSMLMMGGPVEGRPASLHLYVDDLEGTYQRALDAGATSNYPITQAAYGERFGGIVDPAGNHWYVAERATSKIVHAEMGAVTPYLHPEGAAKYIEFLKAALGAEQLERYDEPSRGVAHCKMRVGNSVLELGDPGPGSHNMPTMFYLYVDDVDGVYQQALGAGATSIHPPAMQHYGDYVGAFTDPAGNQWYAARHTPQE